MNVRPFALLSNAALDAVKRHLIGELNAWCADWGVDQTAVEVFCTRAWESDSHVRTQDWQGVYRAGGKAIWLAFTPALFGSMQQLLFPSDRRYESQSARPSSIAAEGAASAVKDLTERIAASLVGPETLYQADDIPGADLWSVASGAMVATIRIGDQTATWALNYGCIKGLPQFPATVMLPPIAEGNLQQALSHVSLSLPVEIGQAEVDVASLLTLALGDVIRLDSCIDKPINVRGPNGEALFGAHLGRQDKAVAIEVTHLNQKHTGVMK